MKILLIVDVQNDFLRGGSLAIARADEIITPINRLIRNCSKRGHLVWATMDAHPPHHMSFASTFNVKPFSCIDGQTKWPDHCIRDTIGQQLSKHLLSHKISRVFTKGTEQTVDAYSAIADNDGKLLPLHDAIVSHHVTSVYIVGLALDFCVRATIRDLLRYFNINIICDLQCTRMINHDQKALTKIVKQYSHQVHFLNYVGKSTYAKNIPTPSLVLPPSNKWKRRISQTNKIWFTNAPPNCHNFTPKSPRWPLRRFIYAILCICATIMIITIIIMVVDRY